LPVLNNYRNVLAAVLTRHGAGAAAAMGLAGKNEIAEMANVFPGFELKPLEIFG
jgi:hypothetical protein